LLDYLFYAEDLGNGQIVNSDQFLSFGVEGDAGELEIAVDYVSLVAMVEQAKQLPHD